MSLEKISQNLYDIVYTYVCDLWHDVVDLQRSTNVLPNGENFMGNAKVFSHLWLNGLHYGAATLHRGKSARFAYINGREPVEIQHLLTVEHRRRDGTDPLVTHIAIVRHFCQDDDLPEFPWEMW